MYRLQKKYCCGKLINTLLSLRKKAIERHIIVGAYCPCFSDSCQELCAFLYQRIFSCNVASYIGLSYDLIKTKQVNDMNMKRVTTKQRCFPAVVFVDKMNEAHREEADVDKNGNILTDSSKCVR